MCGPTYNRIPSFLEELKNEFMTAGRMSQIFSVGNLTAATFISRRFNEGRPFPYKLVQWRGGQSARCYQIKRIVIGALVDGHEVVEVIEKENNGLTEPDEWSEKTKTIVAQITEIERLRDENKKLSDELHEITTGKVNDGLLNRLEILSVSRRKDLLKDLCGVYFLIDGNEIVYVGQSISVIQRIRSHVNENIKEFTHYSVVDCGQETLNFIESAYIRKFKPKYNLNNGNVQQAQMFEYDVAHHTKFSEMGA